MSYLIFSLRKNASYHYYTNVGIWAKYFALKNSVFPSMESRISDGFASHQICSFHYHDCCNKPSSCTKPDMQESMRKLEKFTSSAAPGLCYKSPAYVTHFLVK